MGLSLAQFNSSTLKASYDSTNKKQICLGIPTCEYCEYLELSTPYKLLVTFENIVECNYCHTYGGDSYKYSWAVGFNPNQSFVLTQFSGVSCIDGEPIPCHWSSEIFNNALLLQRWNEQNDCDGDPDLEQYIDLMISFHKSSISWGQLAFGKIWFWYCGAGQPHIFFADPVAHDNNYCCQRNSNISNENDCFSNDLVAGYGGTATIIEL